MIKRISIFALAFLLISGVSFAANIPKVVDPESSGESWGMTVYNNSGADLDDGDIVIWDIDSSTSDAYMYVTRTSTANTGPIAGVVRGTITSGSVGEITIFGLDTCDVVTTTNITGAGSPIGTSTTAGSGQRNDNSDGYIVGHSQQAITVGSSTAVIFVNPERN